MKGIRSFAAAMAFLLPGAGFSAKGAEQAGSLDISFDTGGLDSSISYLASGWGKVIGLDLGPNDEIYIGGHFSGFALQEPPWQKEWNGLARLSQDGSLDETFAVPIYSYNASNYVEHIDAHDIFVEGDGTVWVGFDTFGHRFSANGTTIPLTNSPYVLKVYPDGRYLEYLFGSRSIRRMHPEGIVDSNFAGLLDVRQLAARLILRDGKLLSSDQPDSQGNASAPKHLNRFNEDGTLDATFQPVDFGTNVTVDLRLLLERANGQIYAAGEFTGVNGKPFGRLVRLNADGTLDESFRPDPRLTSASSPRVLAMALQPNGKLLVGGFSTSEAPISGGIARLSLDGSIDSTFDPGTGVSEGNDDPQYPAKIVNIQVQRDGRILIAGDFTKFNGVMRDGVARLHGDPVEPLRIEVISVEEDSGMILNVTGTADFVEVQRCAELGASAEWETEAVEEMGEDDFLQIELPNVGDGSGFFRVRR